MKHILRSLDISTEFSSISMISHECWMVTVDCFPLIISKIRMLFGSEGSIRERTSALREICLAFRNSTLRPWNLGVETSLPS